MNTYTIDLQLRHAVLAAQGEELGKLETMLKQMLKDNPANPDAVYGMGLICLRKEREEDAAPLFEEALENLPASCQEAVEIHVILTRIYSCLKDFARVIPHAKYLLEREPGNPAIYVDLCHAYLKLGDFECFIPHAKYLLEHDPHNPNIYQDLCYAYHQLGDFKSVKQYLKLGMKQADRGFQFQPDWVPELTLDEQGAINAVTDFKRRSDAYLAGGDQRVVITWSPVGVTETGAELRGATRNLGDGTKPEFELLVADHVDGDGPPLVRYEAMPITEHCNGANGAVVWQSTVRNLEPGPKYQYSLILTDNVDAVVGEPQVFETKCYSKPDVITGKSILVGLGSAVVNGTVGRPSLQDISSSTDTRRTALISKHWTGPCRPRGRDEPRTLCHMF